MNRMNKNHFKVFEIRAESGCGRCVRGLLVSEHTPQIYPAHRACVCVRLQACRRLSGRLTGDIRMQRRASMATVSRRVREDGAGGISGSQLDAIQQVLEGGGGCGVCSSEDRILATSMFIILGG